MNTQRPCHILLVEDEPADAHWVTQTLRAAPQFASELVWVSSLAAAKVSLQSRLPDLLLLDLSLPDSQGISTLHDCRQLMGSVPIIVLTGHDDNEFALQTLQQGAQDYLIKGSFDQDMLIRAMRYAISRASLEARLRDSEARMALALEGAKLGFWDWQLPSGQIILSERWGQILGYEPNELPHSMSELQAFVHADDWPGMQEALQRHLDGATVLYEAEYRLQHRHGHWIWVYVSGRVMERDRQGKPLRMVGIHQDITRRKETEARDRLLVAALNAVSLGVVITDTDARVEWANPAFTELSGYAFDETKGRKPSELVKSGRQDVAFYQAMWQAIKSGQSWHGELVNRRKNGELYHEELTIAPVPDEAGQIQHFIGVKQDVSERKRLEAELLEMATTDPLTGLYNRRYFMNRLAEELLRMHRHSAYQIAILMLDLDHFKQVNDRYGHAMGDELLRHVANLMRGAVRKIDMLARLGGEEFAILMVNSSLQAATAFAERLREEIASSPLCMQGGLLKVTASIGVADMKASDHLADSVLIRADQALYRSKDAGRNQVQVFVEPV